MVKENIGYKYFNKENKYVSYVYNQIIASSDTQTKIYGNQPVFAMQWGFLYCSEDKSRCIYSL